MKKKPLYAPLGYYHIFNHANGKENLFINSDNYRFFLRKFKEKVSDVVDTMAYCLMPNHFHILVRVKEEKVIHEFLSKKKLLNPALKIPSELTLEELNHYIVHRQIHNFLGGYSKAFNKYHNRAGSLIRQNTCRKLVGEKDYLKNVIRYININAVLHNFVVKPEEWEHTSYHAFLTEKETKIPREEILEWFGGLDAFIQFHLDKKNRNLEEKMEK